MKRTLFFVSLTLLLTGLFAGHAAAQDCVEPPAGLVSWWPGDGNADDVFADHNGTILGGMGFEPGMVGDAFSADGIDDSIRIPNTGGVFDLVSQWTTHAWVFPRSATPRGRILNKMSFVGNRNTFGLIWITDHPDPLCSPAPGDSVFDAGLERASDDRDFGVCGQVHLPGRWYHVVGVYNGSDLIIYVDGVEEARSTIGFVISYASPDPLMIGAIRPDAEFFDGLLDEVALWNRGLSGEEVRAIFDAGSAGMCQPVPPPTPEELLERIEALEDHTHTYLTGSGVGHNNTEAETGAAEVPDKQNGDNGDSGGDDCPAECLFGCPAGSSICN